MTVCVEVKLGTDVSGWPCVEVSGSMYYQMTLGTGANGWLVLR